METRTITIQTNTPKKGKLDQRSFSCQVLEHMNQKIYVLNETKNDLTRKRFTLTEGCRVIDDGICYPIQHIYYSPRPMYPHIVVFPDSII